MKKFKNLISFLLLLILMVGCSEEKKFTDEEYIKAVSTDLKMLYPRENVSGEVLAFYFVGNHGSRLLFMDGGTLNWRVEKKDNKVEVVGEYEEYDKSVYFPVTIKNEQITVNEEDIYMLDKEFGSKLTLGEVLKEARLKKEYIEILKGIELSSTSLKGTPMGYLTYLILNRAGSDITQDKIEWSAFIRSENEIFITATDENTADINYTMYKEKDSFVIYPDEVNISYYRYEPVTLTDWLSMYELEKQVKKYQSLERQFNY